MLAAAIDLAPVGGGPDRRLPPLLEQKWQWGKRRGAFLYDPEEVETLVLPPFCFYHLPGREARPRSASNPGLERGLARPHLPCAFDAAGFLAEREVMRVRRQGRLYHIAINKYPVLPLHYLAVRPASDPPSTLPQVLMGPEELEDMLRLASILGPPFRLFFNSNRGVDGSRSGSSVNHWHFQIFPLAFGLPEREPRVNAFDGPVELGEMEGWPARHRAYRSRDGRALSTAIWRDVSALNLKDSAYNLELVPREGGEVMALLFPRAPVGDLVLEEGAVLSGDFGGFEMSGGVVVSGARAFGWIRRNPAEAVERIQARMEKSTAPPPPLSRA